MESEEKDTANYKADKERERLAGYERANHPRDHLIEYAQERGWLCVEVSRGPSLWGDYDNVVFHVGLSFDRLVRVAIVDEHAAIGTERTGLWFNDDEKIWECNEVMFDGVGTAPFYWSVGMAIGYDFEAEAECQGE